MTHKCPQKAICLIHVKKLARKEIAFTQIGHIHTVTVHAWSPKHVLLLAIIPGTAEGTSGIFWTLFPDYILRAVVCCWY